MLETNRLILRKFKESDLESFAKINSNKKVCKFLPSIISKEESKEMIKRIIDHFDKYGFGFFAVQLKANNKFIGFIGIARVDYFEPPFKSLESPPIEIAWRLDEQYWNQGLATEGAKAVLDFAFKKLKLKEIVSFTTTNNLASKKVMEKIGMQRDPKFDFKHPNLTKDHPLSEHVLYRITNII